MSANGFKVKPIKKLKTNDLINVTLDGKHKEIMNNFEKEDSETIPELQKKKAEVIKTLNETSQTVEGRLNLQDKIQEINAKIKSLKSKKKELTSNFKIKIDYLELRDKKSLKISRTNKNSRLFIAYYLNNVRLIDNL